MNDGLKTKYRAYTPSAKGCELGSAKSYLDASWLGYRFSPPSLERELERERRDPSIDYGGFAACRALFGAKELISDQDTSAASPLDRMFKGCAMGDLTSCLAVARFPKELDKASGVLIDRADYLRMACDLGNLLDFWQYEKRSAANYKVIIPQ